MQELIENFLNVVAPTYKNRKGYINLRKICKDLGIDARTFYNWKNGDSVPGLRAMVKFLEIRGYELKIVEKDIYDK